MYQFPQLLKIPNLTHAISDKTDGQMSFYWSESEEIIDNRISLFQKLSLDPNNFAATDVKHGNQITSISKKDRGKGIFNGNWFNTDALITSSKKVGLFLMTADCLPIIIVDPTNQALGLVHDGWQGVDNQITIKTINTMSGRFGSKVKDLVITIGPAIASKNYIKQNPSQRHKPAWQPFLKQVKQNHWQIDLIGKLTHDLKQHGLKSHQIISSNIDTFSNKNYFSHVQSTQQNLPQGRFASLVKFT